VRNNSVAPVFLAQTSCSYPHVLERSTKHARAILGTP
jgi:hypothetical protein